MADPDKDTNDDAGEDRDDERARPEAEEREPADRAEESDPDGDSEQPTSRRFRLRELSGPQACLSIVGCGTVAAVLVVALVFGGIRLVVGSLSDDSEDNAATVPEQSGEPIDEIEVGGLNLCDRNIPGITELSLERSDSGDSYADSAEAGSSDARRVSDECSWVVRPGGDSLDEWNFDFEYVALISDGDGADRFESAVSLHGQWVDERSSGSGVADSGEVSFGDEGQFFYSTTEGVESYSMIVRHKSAVYVIELENRVESGAQESGIDSFEQVANRIADRVNIRLDAVVPN
ncbi:hypothetical protein J4H86_22410 [Spiractinospora alimapuensis]|uniref:hypothetical protein n=1 Tax=Spiractinospora alimapuensis TaxID=2820884 RepID=UPI001F37BF18|nr:hypothetical protein [Spiractinospora alimapuensis]QVQ51518.1 hypothetical protein J4H86_22410 [Spiractinospora alimapuensis]